MLRSLLAAALFAPALPAAPVPKELRKPSPKLDGKWKVVGYESNGRPITTSSILNQTWAFDGDQLAITRTPLGKAAVTPAATKITVRADARTKDFDYVMPTGTTRLGRYEVAGDTLTVSLTINTSTGERPHDLSGGTGTLKYTFKRVDPNDDKKK